MDDAEVAVEFAYSAIEEAEYDVLEAQLALDEAAELGGLTVYLSGARART